MELEQKDTELDLVELGDAKEVTKGAPGGLNVEGHPTEIWDYQC